MTYHARFINALCKAILFMENSPLGSKSSIVTFLASDGLKLSGILSSSPRSGRLCLIFIHGLNGSAFSHLALHLASHTASGTSVFSINSRGHDIVSGFSKRTGKLWKRKRIGASLERFEDSVFDIKGAIAALSGLGFRRFILCGHSTGCQKALNYQYKTKDRRVKGLVLLAPTDDYNLDVKRLGRDYGHVLSECRKMIRKGCRDMPAPKGQGMSAQRLDSILNPRRVEGRLFNYNGELREFRSITVPILAVFGSNEEYALKAPSEYLRILEDATSSEKFASLLIEGATHSFDGKEK